MTVLTFVADGTSRNFGSATSWTPNQIPTAADDLVFSTNVASSILVINGTSGSPSLCRSFVTTGYTRTITMGASAQLNVGDGTTGAFTLTAGMTFAPTAGALIKFVSTTTGNNITSAAYRLGSITFDGVGGGWQLQDNLDPVATSTVTLTNGALDINGKTVGNTSGVIFSSNNSNTRSLTIGAGTWKLPSTGNVFVWDIQTATGMTLSAASSTISSINTTGNNSKFAGGGLTYGTLSCTTLTTGNIWLQGANTFSTLTLSIAGTTKNTTSGYNIFANQIVSGTFTSNGNSVSLRNLLYSDTSGTARTITCNGTVTVTQTDFRDIVGAGSASWNLSSITGGAGDGGGNSGITFAAPKSCFYKTAVSDNWSTAKWFTASGGSTPISPTIPMIHDLAIFDVNSVTAASKIITLDVPSIPDTSWNGVANTPAWATATAFDIYGGMRLVSGMTHTGASIVIFFRGRSTNNFYSGGLTWPATNTIVLDAPSGTINQQDNTNFNSSLLQTNNGTWNGNGFTLTNSGGITCNGGAINTGSGAWSLTGSGIWTVGGGTLTLGANCTGAASLTITSGIFDCNGFNITGLTTLTHNGTGTVNLSGQISGSSTFSLTGVGSSTQDTGSRGEYKTTSIINVSAGTHVIRKLTVGTTMTLSSTASLTLTGSASYATNWNITGATCTFKAGTVQLINGAWSVGIDSYTYAG